MQSPNERRRRFEQIYADNHDPVLAYLLRRAAEAEDAADALAETFLTAWRRLDDVPAGERARPWLFGVARRVLANQRRGAGRRSALSLRLRSEVAGATRCFETGEADAAVAAAFTSLPESDREVLALAAWEGLDAGEIAIALGCSRGAARMRLHRSRRRFSRAMDKHGESPHAHLVTA